MGVVVVAQQHTRIRTRGVRMGGLVGSGCAAATIPNAPSSGDAGQEVVRTALGTLAWVPSHRRLIISSANKQLQHRIALQGPPPVCAGARHGQEMPQRPRAFAYRDSFESNVGVSFCTKRPPTPGEVLADMQVAVSGLEDRDSLSPVLAAAWFDEASAIYDQLLLTLRSKPLLCSMALEWMCIVDLAHDWTTTLAQFLSLGFHLLTQRVIRGTNAPYQFRNLGPPPPTVAGSGTELATRYLWLVGASYTIKNQSYELDSWPAT